MGRTQYDYRSGLRHPSRQDLGSPNNWLARWRRDGGRSRLLRPCRNAVSADGVEEAESVPARPPRGKTARPGHGVGPPVTVLIGRPPPSSCTPPYPPRARG